MNTNKRYYVEQPYPFTYRRHAFGRHGQMLQNGNIPAFFIAHPYFLQVVFAKHNSKNARIDALLQTATSDYEDQFTFHMLTTILRHDE